MVMNPMNTTRRMTLILTGAALAALLVGSLVEMPRLLIYNPSTSAPRGWYWVGSSTHLQLHQFVVAQLPDKTAMLADQRQYLPKGVPILKEIGALGGQRVCMSKGDDGGRLVIDGHAVARTLVRDRAGRALTAWPGCRVLAGDELFLLSRHSNASFDSRYFGPIRRSAVIGRAIPLWTW